jgi:phosphoglycolate phosphatase
MIRAVILDLDGTLLDTLEDLADSMNEALAAMGFPVHPLDKYRYFVGDGVHILVERTIPPDRLTPDVLNETTRLYREAYGRNWKRKSRPYPGIVDALESLCADGVKLGVLSNKPQHFTELCVAHFFRSGLLDPVFGQRAEVPRKPDPAGALEICRGWNCRPEQAAFVGDTLTDMRTGRAAQMICFGVAWGFRPVEELLDNGAHHILQHPSDLRQILAPVR